MKNEDIKYKTSTNYERLYKLLKEGNVLIGFTSVKIDGVAFDTHSKVIQMSYNADGKFFDADGWLAESFGKEAIVDSWRSSNVRFIDLPIQIKEIVPIINVDNSPSAIKSNEIINFAVERYGDEWNSPNYRNFSMETRDIYSMVIGLAIELGCKHSIGECSGRGKRILSYQANIHRKKLIHPPYKRQYQAFRQAFFDMELI